MSNQTYIGKKEIYKETNVGLAYAQFYFYDIYVCTHQRIIEDMSLMSSDKTKFNVTFVNEKGIYIIEQTTKCYLLK